MMKNSLILLISLLTFLSCAEKNNQEIVLSKKVKAELDEFILLINRHELKEFSAIGLFFSKYKGEKRLSISLNNLNDCSYFEGVFYYKKEPIFIYFEKEDSLTEKDVKPAIQIKNREKLKENCLEFTRHSPLSESDFDPPIWAYEIDGDEIKLVHESKLRRQPK
ncbi:hypothetical protein [Sinomicrobium sp. M5D2P17]